VTPSGQRPDVVHVAVLDDAQAAMLDAVEQSGGFTLCVGGDFGRFARPALVGLPFEPPLAAEVAAMWPRRRSAAPPRRARGLRPGLGPAGARPVRSGTGPPSRGSPLTARPLEDDGAPPVEPCPSSCCRSGWAWRPS
jgi:hypothetical protein